MPGIQYKTKVSKNLLAKFEENLKAINWQSWYDEIENDPYYYRKLDWKQKFIDTGFQLMVAIDLKEADVHQKLVCSIMQAVENLLDGDENEKWTNMRLQTVVVHMAELYGLIFCSDNKKKNQHLDLYM